MICFAGQENPTYVNEINDDDEIDTKVQFTINYLKIFNLMVSFFVDINAYPFPYSPWE